MIKKTKKRVELETREKKSPLRCLYSVTLCISHSVESTDNKINAVVGFVLRSDYLKEKTVKSYFSVNKYAAGADLDLWRYVRNSKMDLDQSLLVALLV